MFDVFRPLLSFCEYEDDETDEEKYARMEREYEEEDEDN